MPVPQVEMREEELMVIPPARMDKESKLARRVWGQRAGRTAFRRGADRSTNPFLRPRRIPEMHDYWYHGWDAESQEPVV